MDMQHPHKPGDSVPSFMISPKPMYSHTPSASTARVLDPVINESFTHDSDVYTYCDSDDYCLRTPASSSEYNSALPRVVT